MIGLKDFFQEKHHQADLVYTRGCDGVLYALARKQYMTRLLVLQDCLMLFRNIKHSRGGTVRHDYSRDLVNGKECVNYLNQYS
jgi:hypothetical protein